MNRRTKKLQYKIQWTNSRPTWQPCEDVRGCDSDIKDFHARNPTKPGPPDWFRAIRFRLNSKMIYDSFVDEWFLEQARAISGREKIAAQRADPTRC